MQAKHRTLFQTLAVVCVMGTLAWASVPLYDWFCRVTGYGGTTAVAANESEVVLDKTILVRFDASLESGMPWKFEPVERVMEVKVGETGLAFYSAHNPTNRPVAGSASYNVAPFEAGSFFTKIQCFCFEEQVLLPGETVMMPVSFFVEPDIVTDRDGKFIDRITLSYTFYEIDLPDQQAALILD